MNFGTGWQELRTKSGPKCPKLFYKFEANENGYNLQLTDLVALWSTASVTEEIQAYARLTRASIDPAEPSQLKRLLEKLAESLTEGTNSIKQDDSRGDEAVALSTTLQLKKPLQPLRWEFSLEPQSASEMAESILRPCLHKASEAQKKIESLMEVISDKDRVISKLLDKFEGSAIDLSLVFPSITGVRARKGQVTVKQAQRHIPGLAQFSQDEWQESFEPDSPYSSLEARSLSTLMIGCDKCPKHTPQEHQEWLRKLPKHSATTSQIAKIEANRSSSPINEEDSDSENEFETQEKRKPRASSEDTSDGTAESTDGANEQRRSARKSKPLPSNYRRQMNGRSRISPTNSRSQVTSPNTGKRATGVQTRDLDASETASESDLDAPPKSKQKARLGALGKKSKSSAELAVSLSSTRNAAPTSSPPLDETRERHQALATDNGVTNTSSNSRNQTKSSSSSSSSSAFNAETAKETQVVLDAKPSRAPSTPPRLGQIGKTKKSESATPDRKQTKDPSFSKDGIEPGSTQTTPTRHRLGRLGRSTAQSQQPGHKDEPANGRSSPFHQDAASDASTASTASPSPPASPSKAADEGRQTSEPSSHPSSRSQQVDTIQDASAISQTQSRSQSQSQSLLANKQPTPEMETEELTKEEIANRRREELKRKIEPPGLGTTTGGLRKKRKF